ncbi:uncharacterized protein LOC129803329 [Phlebotomus papatasi]|uniref:uncharacterized protein LOC129803329 n=1 Tax=Phlebotomus papatasi TaxID=29031 RepID=UPI002483E6AA|nr:uncharacterized protein LOC129803329 [Phlebotomus papatasi]
MGCSSSQSSSVAPENGTEGSPATYPPSTAFEIPLDDDDSSLVKKHPPKRLRRLEETPSTPPSIEELQEKLANAELRRQLILQQKVANVMIRTNGDDRNSDDLDENDNKSVKMEVDRHENGVIST